MNRPLVTEVAFKKELSSVSNTLGKIRVLDFKRRISINSIKKSLWVPIRRGIASNVIYLLEVRTHTEILSKQRYLKVTNQEGPFKLGLLLLHLRRAHALLCDNLQPQK